MIDTFTKMPKIVGDLGQLIVAIGFKKLPNLVTLITNNAIGSARSS